MMHDVLTFLKSRCPSSGHTLASVSHHSVWLMGCLHDPANVQQKLPANLFKIHVIMLDVCWRAACSGTIQMGTVSI